MSRLKVAWADSLQREAPGGVPHNKGVLFTCVMTACTATEDVVYSSGRMPPEAIRQKLQRKGWRIMRRGCMCPDCQNKPSIEKVFEDMVSLKSEPEAIARVRADPNPVPIPPAPSENQTMSARRVHRQVMGWLEEAYEEDAKRYKRGFSDQSIADETGAAVAYVAKCREDYFGVLGTPPEVDALVAELAAIRKDINAEKDKIDTFAREHNGRLDGLRSKAKNVENKLSTLATQNGWKQA